MGKHARSTEFACYVRNYTGNAVRLKFRSAPWRRRPGCAAEQSLWSPQSRRYAAEPAAAGRERTRTVAAGAPEPSAVAASDGLAFVTELVMIQKPQRGEQR